MQKLQEQKDKCETVTDLGQKIDVCTSAVLLLRDSVDNLAAIAANAAAAQLRDIPPSPLFSSPCIEEEESSKEEEDYIPSIISPTSSSENCFDVKTREESILINDLSNMSNAEASFEIFWEAYGYKRGKRRAFKKWSTLQPAKREAALAAIGAYKADCERFNRQMCWPSTYLNQHRWEDDFNSGLENANRGNGKSKFYTREDFRRREREQRMEGYARLAAEFREGNC